MKAEPLNLNRHQALTLFSLCLGYAGYYLCRSDLSVITPLLLADTSIHVDKEGLGWIASVALNAYAAGKVISGVAVDNLGGRKLFLLGMLGSILCTVLFGLGSSAGLFMAVWAVNRFFQSTGWNALVKVSTNWFSHYQYGRVMGFLSLSFLFGDAIGRYCLGQLIQLGFGWRAVLFAAAGILGLICLFCFLTVRNYPEKHQVVTEAEVNPNNLFADDEGAEKGGAWRLLKPFLTSEAFWCVAVMSFGYTLIRETFNLWLPQYLKEVADMADGQAGKYSSLFPFFGGFSVLFCGWLSDNPMKGRRGQIMAATSFMMTVCLVFMGLIPPHSGQFLPVLLTCAIALLLLGPYCFLGGAISMELGGSKGSATAAGLVDAAGYIGGTLSGVAVGAVAQKWGWGGAFTTLGGFSLMVCLASSVYSWRHEGGTRHAKEAPTP